jgi:hypothetical protein
MADFPAMQLEDMCDPFDWPCLAHFRLPGETVTLDLRLWAESELRPMPSLDRDDPDWSKQDAEWRDLVERTLRGQMLIDSYRPLRDQLRERARESICLGFFL